MNKEQRAAWLAERHEFVTASDVAAVMGLNPHKSRKKVYRDKVHGTTEDIDRFPVVMAGKFLEAGILAWHGAHRFFEVQGWDDYRATGDTKLTGSSISPAGLVIHPETLRLAATPDGLTWDEAGKVWVTEVKNVKHDKWSFDWAKTWRSRNSTNIPVSTVVHSQVRELDGSKLRAPVYYWAQLQAQMACLGIPRGRLVVCFGGQSRADLDYMLDTEFESRMIEEVETFWSEVETGRELL